ncbi:uncharacterized protein [Cicer arietinum]|uniref:Uncharacterized protein LOC101509770 n=1 Tax=Cicer arietinum TaxID=3827 RepID=A0A1S3EBG8_CICAR|nr:uncharacterized protein LOC101509770 [Cicer arietinum]XP_027191241.1 uncharacterized protein LOC101509770 [Cicer arietinum]
MIPEFVLPTVTLTTETSLDFPDQHSSTAWIYDPISSRATYTGRVVRTSRRVGEVSHVEVTHERIDYPVPSRLVLGVNGAWKAVEDASVRGETEATVGMATPIVRAGDVVLGPENGEKDKEPMLAEEDIIGLFRLVGDQSFVDESSVPQLVPPRVESELPLPVNDLNQLSIG